MRSLAVVLVLLTALGAGDTLLLEDFDGPWDTANPPAGWTIFFTGTPGNDDWHRRDALQVPWSGHPSPYVSILYNLQGDTLQDSLISPVIDCSGFRNVTLRCSTFFARNLNMPYTAQLRYSVDGGATYPHLLRNYRDLSVGPLLETFTLSNADNLPDLRVAWVFEGNKSYISHWSIDDVVITGTPIPDDDIECRSIVAPRLRMPPGDLVPQARFRNNGLNPHFNIPVHCRLYDADTNLLFAWSDIIPDLNPGETRNVGFLPQFPLSGTGRYLVEFWHENIPDDDPSNDTLWRAFEVTWLEELRYDNGTAAGYDAWPVGHYGWGARFEPAFPPVQIESLKVYLRATGNPDHDRYQLAVVNERDGQPGEFLHRSPVLTATNGWNSVPMADSGNEIRIPPGEAFYVFYLQVGEPPECPGLGYDNARSSGASYWQYHAGAFAPDTGDGDYMIRVVTNREVIPPLGFDLRLTHIEDPWYEFVQRPHDAPIAVAARVENHGALPSATNTEVRCNIQDDDGFIVFDELVPLASLVPGEDTLVRFSPWVPQSSGPYTVMVAAMMLGDENFLNNGKTFDFAVRKGAHTGMSGSGAYAWTDSDTAFGPVFDWVNPHPDSSSLVIAGGDEFRIYVPMLFEFPFYDTSYTSVYVTTNGWLAVGPDPGRNDSLPREMPDPGAPNRVVAPWWDNLACGPGHGGGKVWARWLGTAPNRRLVIIWENVNRVGTDTTDLITFQAILHESGQIVYQYLDVTTGDLQYDNARNAAIGLENELGDDGLTYLYARPPMSAGVNDLENRVRSGTAIRLNPVRRDVAAIEVVEPVGYVFPRAYKPVARIQNYGSVVDSIVVTMKFRPGPYVDTVVVLGLMPGADTLVAFREWDAEVGTYTATCSTWMNGDEDPSNDVATATVIVSPWIQRPDIPVGSRRRKVRGAAMTYARPLNSIYALKGANDEELWTFDLATGEWDVVDSVPLAPSGRRPRYGNALVYDSVHGASGTLWVLKAGGVPDFYSYDIATATWTTCSSAVVNTWGYREPRRGAALTLVPNLGPAGAVFCLVGNNTNLLLRYDISSGLWDVLYDDEGRRFDVPWGPRARRCRMGTGMVFADTALFVVKGSNTVEAYSLNPFTLTTHELDSTNLSRDRSGRRRKVKGGGSMGYLDGALYLLKGGNRQEFWKFRMDQDSWVQLTDIPFALEGRRRRPKRGSALVGADSTVFCLKGSHGFEFWEYGPSGDTAVGAVLAGRPVRSGVMTRTHESLEPQLVAGPNPMSRHLVVQLTGVLREQTRIAVYDAGGRLVRRLADAVLEPGRHSFRWDGRDEARRVVPAGVYLLVAESGPEVMTRKLVIQR